MQKNVLWLIVLLVLGALMGLLFRLKAVEQPPRATSSPTSRPSAIGSTAAPGQDDELVMEVDLVNRTSPITCSGPEPVPLPIFWVQDLKRGPGVLQISLPPFGRFHRARFVLSYHAPPQGISFHVADSASCNGYGGNAGTQSNNAELKLDGNNLLLYGNDFTPGRDHQIGEHKNFIQMDESDVIEVADEMVSGRQTWKSPNLFCLSGQLNNQGPVNYDIFVGFNQVVNGTRKGSGLSRVRVELRP